MKKIITITTLLIMAMAISGCTQQENSQTEPASENQDTASEAGAWKTYSSAELNIDFEYPENYIFMDLMDSSEKAILIGDKEFPRPEIAPYYHAPIKISKYDETLFNDMTSSLIDSSESTITIDSESATVVQGKYKDYPAPEMPAKNNAKYISVPSKSLIITAQDMYAYTSSDWQEISSTLSGILNSIEFKEEAEENLSNSYHSEKFNYDVNYPEDWTLRDTSGTYGHPMEKGVGILLGPDSMNDFLVSIITSQLSTEYLAAQIKDTLTPNQTIASETTVQFGGQESVLIQIGNEVNNCTIYRYLTPHGGSWTSETTSSSCPTYSNETQSQITSVAESIQFN